MKTIYTAEQLKSVYGEPQVQQPTPEPQKEGILKSIAKDVAGTLVVNPVSRIAEAVATTAFPESDVAKGYEMFRQEGKGQDVLGVNVPSLTGGARQITGEALKTASYLFPYGKVAGLAGKAVGKIGGNIISGATGGYLTDVGGGLTDQNQTVGEALIPGAGTAIGAAIPLVGPTLRGAGRLTAKTGEKIVDAVIPADTIEAKILQTYKKNNPFLKRVSDVLKGTEKAPTTAGKTVATEGLMGTKTQIGIQARRAQDKIWENVISPRLKASGQAVDLDGFFAKVQDDIIANNPEVARQKSLLNALNSFKDDYAGINSVSLEKLQKLKEGWAEFVPEKFYKGENIAGNAKQVQALLADEARQTIYSQLGDDVKQAYLDYGNLKGIADMGITSMTGQKLKGGAGSFAQEIFSQAVTPVGTVGGQAIYKLGKGIEFIGNLGAKNLGEALGVNLKFPGDMAVDDISKTVKKAKSLPNKQGGFIKLGQDAKAPMATQANRTTRMTPKTSNISKSSPKSTSKSIDDPLFEFKTMKGTFADGFKGKSEVMEAIKNIGGVKNVERVLMAIDDLKPTEIFDINNLGVQRALKEIKSGINIPLIVDEAGNILDGNHRYVAQQMLGKMNVRVIKPKTNLGSSSLKGKGVIPENSQTITAYHGTNNKFENFDVSKLMSKEKDRLSKAGFWFTDSKTTAKSYGRTVKETTLEFKKPKTIDADGQTYGDFRNKLEDAVEEAQKNGNDGLIIKNLSDRKDWGNYEPATHYIALDKNVIKPKVVKPSSPETNLINEAKKYKTAEEFVDSVKTTKLSESVKKQISNEISKTTGINDYSNLSVVEKGKLFKSYLEEIWKKANKK